MKRYFLFLLIFITTACTIQESNSISESPIQNTQQFKRQTVSNWETGQPIYSILLPNTWFLNPYAEENQVYISVDDDYTVSRKVEGKYFSYSETPNLADKAKVGGYTTDKVYTTEDIIKIEIAPKLNAKGFELTHQYPLIIINNQSLYNSYNIYTFPEKINTIATEWQNDSGRSILCTIELITNPALYADKGYITTFNYNAEILTIESDHFEDFKNAYLSVCRSYILDKEYATENYQSNQFLGSIWQNQMVVRSDEERSFLNNRDWHNSAAYSTWREDQICMGILVKEKNEDSYIATYDDYDYNPDSTYIESDWGDYSN